MHHSYIMNSFQHEEDKVDFKLFEYLYEEIQQSVSLYIDG